MAELAMALRKHLCLFHDVILSITEPAGDYLCTEKVFGLVCESTENEAFPFNFTAQTVSLVI